MINKIEEKWTPVRNYEDLYEVSNTGKVRSIDREIIDKRGSTRCFKGRELKKIILPNGYFVVGLSKNGFNKLHYVHRLVAEMFIPNPNNYPCINHKDEVKINNNVDNLEFCTYKYNNDYSNNVERMNRSTRKRVIQLTKDYKVVFIYESEMEASRKTGIQQSSISRCCFGHAKTAGKYLWRHI